MLGKIIRVLAEKERKKALAASSVKIYGNDVLASFKIVYGFVIFYTFSVCLGLTVAGGTYCERYLDYFGDLWTVAYAGIGFAVFWPIYLYFSLILSDRAVNHFKKLYIRVLSLCSPVAIENARTLREDIKDNLKKLMKKYGTEIFPNLKVKKAVKKIEFNDSINDAFGLLSEIGLS